MIFQSKNKKIKKMPNVSPIYISKHLERWTYELKITNIQYAGLFLQLKTISTP